MSLGVLQNQRMRKIEKILLLLATASVTLACQREIVPEEQPFYPGKSGQMTITALADGIGTPSKASAAYYYNVLWDKGDRICVKNSGQSAIFTLVSGEGTNKGTFASETLISGDVEAFYPASTVSDGSLVWPSEQDYSNMVPPMYCKKKIASEDGDSQTEEFSFSSLGAILQLVFNTTQKDVVLKSLSIRDGEKTMSGSFEVVDGRAVITSTDRAGITVNFTGGLQLGATSKYFNLAIPAGEYKDLTLTFITTDGYRCEMHSSTFPVVERNTVCRVTLTSSTFAPAILIDDAVQLYPGSPYWSISNLGAATPEEVGNYYAWGYAEGCVRNSANDGWVLASDRTAVRQFNVTDFPERDKTTFVDPATAALGEEWRMPSARDFRNLIENCDIEYVTTGVKGIRFNGRGAFAGNSIFLPVTSFGYGTDYVSTQTGNGYYWSGDDGLTPGVASYLKFFSDGEISSIENEFDKFYGFPIRPVKTITALPGRFTVNSDGGQVRFSSGNLQARYDGAEYHWDFATNQYDVLGVSMDNKTGENYTLDLFSWSSLNSSYGTNPNGETEDIWKVFVDWGKAYCSSHKITPETTWRTLSKDEWHYIVVDRPASTVCGVPNARIVPIRVFVTDNDYKDGYVLFPDLYAHPSVLPALNNINAYSISFDSNIYDLKQWKKMEEAGAVFIPAWELYWTSNDYDRWEMYAVDAWTSTHVEPFYSNHYTHERKCRVRLVTGLIPEVAVEIVKLDNEQMELAVGEDKKLAATVLPVNAANRNVTWKSSDETIATVTDDGTVTGVKEGEAEITVTAAGGKTATCTVSVRFVDVESITLDNAELTLFPSRNKKLSVTILPSNASDKTLTWESSDKAIATVSADGTVTGVAEGIAVITATSVNGKKCSCAVSVPLILPGKFTVGENKTVRFAKGNLTYSAAGGFSFTPAQYLTGSKFYWSKDATEAIKPEYDWNAPRSESDVFFSNDTDTTPCGSFTVDGCRGIFRTLSQSEWIYLIYSRSMTGGGYELVSGVTFKDDNSKDATFCGLVLFPDGFTGQSTWKTDYTTWKQVVDAGLVFFPDEANGSAGDRFASYWTSTASSVEQAWFLFIANPSMGYTGISLVGNNRDRHYFVRLVTDFE